MISQWILHTGTGFNSQCKSHCACILPSWTMNVVFFWKNIKMHCVISITLNHQSSKIINFKCIQLWYWSTLHLMYRMWMIDMLKMQHTHQRDSTEWTRLASFPKHRWWWELWECLVVVTCFREASLRKALFHVIADTSWQILCAVVKEMQHLIKPLLYAYLWESTWLIQPGPLRRPEMSHSWFQKGTIYSRLHNFYNYQLWPVNTGSGSELNWETNGCCLLRVHCQSVLEEEECPYSFI